jgi:hypothetical protein
MELDVVNPTKVSNETGRRRQRHASRWGGRRRGCDSGELLPAVQGMGASTSNPHLHAEHRSYSMVKKR